VIVSPGGYNGPCGMGNTLATLRRRLPGRRRREWRFVSGRRRRFGLVLFVLLALLAGGYWYLTNDARIQRQARQYLQRLTGARVQVDSARFSLFGGIRLRNLRLHLDGDAETPFFQSASVVLSHRPWSLFGRGRLEPTQIVCVHSRVRLVQDVHTGRWNTERIFPIAGSESGQGEALALLPIRLRDTELEVVDLDDGQALPVGRMFLNMALQGDDGDRMYRFDFEEQAAQPATIRGSGTIDAVTGQTHVSGWVGLKGLDKALPRKYRQWKKRYQLAGEMNWTGDTYLASGGQAKGWRQLDRLTFNLANVSMVLPAAEGGLKLSGVRGTMVFQRDGIQIRRLVGAIPQMPGATFALAGRYDGYEPDSPFRVSLTVKDLQLPLGADLVAGWDPAIREVLEEITPAGDAAVKATVHRGQDGKLYVDGEAELSDVAIRLPYVPLQVTGLKGRIRMGGGRLTLENLQGRHDRAAVAIGGWIDLLAASHPAHDLRIVLRDMPFSAKVHGALPGPLRRAWDTFAPRGQANVTVLDRRPRAGQRTRSVTIDLTGKASMEYEGFPYRLDGLEGQVVIGPERTVLRSVRGGSGPMRCTLDGWISVAEGRDDFDIAVDITDLPLDARVERALPIQARVAYRACGLSGRVDITGGKIWCRTGKDSQFKLPVALRNARLRHAEFPLPIDRVNGKATITRPRIVLERLIGYHGRSRLTISGQAPIDADEELRLAIDAAALTMDAELRKALSADARRAWDLLAPSGVADVTVAYRAARARVGTATQPATASAPSRWKRIAYRLNIRPKDLRVTYRHFPYPLRCVGGEAILKPDRMVLKKLTGRAGAGNVVLDGEVVTDEAKPHAVLSVRTDKVPIDKALLKALPGGLVEVLGLRAGGTASLDLDRLEIYRLPAPASGPAPSTASAPASAPAPAPLGWRLAGTIGLTDAAMDLGLGSKQVTGRIKGTMACAGPPKSLTAAADLTVGRLLVGQRRLTGLTARLAKDARSTVLRIDDIVGAAFGGRVAGSVRVRLAGPDHYALNLSVENASLASLLQIGDGPARAPRVQGLLSGTLEMTGTVGQAASRRAKGRLKIARAKMYKLPVLLGFLHVVHLTLPSDNAFHSADVDYYLRANTLVFREMHLRGSALSMLGAGTMDLKSKKLSLTFITGPPRKLPGMSATLKEVLRGVMGQLMTVRVTGTIARPQTRTVPLRNLDATLRELTNPEGK